MSFNSQVLFLEHIMLFLRWHFFCSAYHSLISRLHYSCCLLARGGKDLSCKAAKHYNRTCSKVRSCSLAAVQQNESQWFIRGFQQLPLWRTPLVLWKNPRVSQFRGSCGSWYVWSCWLGPTKALLGGAFFFFVTCQVTPPGFGVKTATIMKPCFI